MLVYIEPYKLQVLPGSVNLTNPTPTVDYSSTFTVPAGVYTITVTIIGGGGGGGGEQDGCTGGAGGGGGGWRVETISVTPGQVIPYTIGKRGEGGHYRPIGTDYPARTGGDTTFAGFTSTGGGPGKSVRYEGGPAALVVFRMANQEQMVQAAMAAAAALETFMVLVVHQHQFYQQEMDQVAAALPDVITLTVVTIPVAQEQQVQLL